LWLTSSLQFRGIIPYQGAKLTLVPCDLMRW
jgi:hypothetical protein